MIAVRAREVIAELLGKPLQPTDSYGNPKGAPTTLQAILTAQIESWATTPVNREGRPSTEHHCGSKPVPRLDWMLGEIVSDKMRHEMAEETKKIASQLKDGATKVIAKQIADKISGLVLK